MITALTETVTALSTGNEVAISRLETIGWRIKKAAALEDIRLINTHLAECLHSIQEETLRQKEEASKFVTRLKSSLEGRGGSGYAPAALGPGPDFDPITGLMGRTAAEEELRSALQSRSHTFAIVFTLKGLQTLNAHSGRTVGDQALKYLGQELVKRLSSPHQLFRWGGPCVIGVIERAEPIEAIQAEASRIVSRRLDFAVEAKGRSSLIRLESGATVIPLFTARSLEQVIQQIESLIDGS